MLYSVSVTGGETPGTGCIDADPPSLSFRVTHHLFNDKMAERKRLDSLKKPPPLGGGGGQAQAAAAPIPAPSSSARGGASSSSNAPKKSAVRVFY
jgi:hypothetical protein